PELSPQPKVKPKSGEKSRSVSNNTIISPSTTQKILPNTGQENQMVLTILGIISTLLTLTYLKKKEEKNK
ncbi:TPA: LPXTG cell wall anchor domain-containing protein, partial [Streptococcus suis]